MENLHNVPGGDLIGRTLSGNMGASSEATEELNRRARTMMGEQPQSMPPLPSGYVKPLSRRANRIANVFFIGAFLAVMWLAFRSAIADAVRGNHGPLALLVGVIVVVVCLALAGIAVLAVLKFLRRHKLLTLALIAAGAYWLYLNVSIPRPDLSPVHAPAAQKTAHGKR
jgi:hypothetical protein